MASLFGLGRKKESETAENEVRNDARNVTSGAGTGSGYNNRNNTSSEEARNMNYEGSTGSGARSGATGSTSAFEQRGQNTGSSNTRTGTTGTTGTTSTTTGRSAGTGISEGFAGLNITHRSGFDTNHPVIGDTNIVCDTKYYTAVEDRPVIKEIKTYIREHHPIEKEFVVETRPTGQEREQVHGRTQEVVDTKERIVETSIPDPCGGVPTTQYSHGYTGSGSSGTTGTGSYGTHNTGSTAENVKSYIPGTDANKEARYEQGRGTGSGSTGTGSGYTGTGGGYGAGSGASGTGSGAGGAGRTIT